LEKSFHLARELRVSAPREVAVREGGRGGVDQERVNYCDAGGRVSEAGSV
jgi:hypothetical protein